MDADHLGHTCSHTAAGTWETVVNLKTTTTKRLKTTSRLKVMMMELQRDDDREARPEHTEVQNDNQNLTHWFDDHCFKAVAVEPGGRPDWMRLRLRMTSCFVSFNC